MDTLMLLNKQIDLSESTILYNRPVTLDSLKNEWDTYNCEWTVKEDWLTGKNPSESAGMAFLKMDFPGNILLEFEGRTVYPSSHDIDFMWNGEWDPTINSCGIGYIGGIGGWWTGRVGIEKSPEYKLRATTGQFRIIPGTIYRIMAGSVDGNCFVFIDGREIIEITDPDPIDHSIYQKVAFSAWSSHIQIRNIVIRQISWKPLERSYPAEL